MYRTPDIGNVVTAFVAGTYVTGTVIAITPHKFLDFDHYRIRTDNGSTTVYLDEIRSPLEPALAR